MENMQNEKVINVFEKCVDIQQEYYNKDDTFKWDENIFFSELNNKQMMDVWNCRLMYKSFSECEWSREITKRKLTTKNLQLQKVIELHEKCGRLCTLINED